ncbi:MAG: DUF2520 domain-containing protein [Bacteroidaceae bacterium]|nr:DUF2520 domain-containing protein [Bacteroidaceae bacterium]MBQ9294108.1 DUF2520 domain-containing protein [Bacteroidaceae bacterium]
MGARTYRTVLIGAGNVASFLKANIKLPFELTHVGGRQRACSIPRDADLYIIAVSDRAISSVSQELKDVEGLVVHTAGSVPMDVLSSKRRGVFYPLQTLSRKRQIPASKVPFYIEASREEDLELLRLLAESMGSKAEQMDSQRRKYLHLAAVFCCNFVNRLYGITADLLAEHDIPFSAMLPLIHETADKVDELTPSEAQTGPAVRWDEAVMEHQMSLLNDEQRQLYQLISKSIHKASPLTPLLKERGTSNH